MTGEYEQLRVAVRNYRKALRRQEVRTNGWDELRHVNHHVRVIDAAFAYVAWRERVHRRVRRAGR